MKIQYLFVLLFASLFFRCSDSTSPTDEKAFGIYLLKDTLIITSDAKKLPLNSLQVQDSPIISIEDIETYNWSEQTMSLTSEAFKRFGSAEGKVKSAFGLPFVVMIDQTKIYLGNIYPAYSSYMHEDLPSIMVAPFTEMRISRAPNKNINDVRMDERIYSVLKNNNKLRM